jgi:hypothetical protein
MSIKGTILVILLFVASMAGCSNENIKSNIEIENNEPKLFNDLLSLTQYMNQFEGTAYVGSLSGPCYMVLLSNSNGDNIAELRYQINNYYQDKADKVDETYIITELNRKSAKKEGFGLTNTQDFEDIYFYGNVKGLKASINGGAITDGSGSGNIWFVLDSVHYELTYIMSSSANWSFHGSIVLSMEQYIKLKELFTNETLSENEVNSILKSGDLLEFSSNDTNFIVLGNNNYKVRISKAQIINNSNLNPLFSLTIKNVSDRNIDRVKLWLLYESTPASAWSNARRGYEGLNPLTYEVLTNSTLGFASLEAKNSPLWLDLYFSNPSNTQSSKYISEDERRRIIGSLSTEVKFTFSLVFKKPGYYFNYGRKEPIHFNEMSIAQILNNSEFLDIWEKINEYPAIVIQVHDFDRDEWRHSSFIYFELVD